jgi:uncharacterized phiE125 gp8 family phage protein
VGLIRISSPNELAVTLADVKEQVEVSESDHAHDAKLNRMIRSAIADVEHSTRRSLKPQTWQLTLREFPFERRVYLPRPPLHIVDSIEYIDSNGARQTLDPSLYQVATTASPGYVEPAYGESWPPLRGEDAESVFITYTAGYTGKIPDQYLTPIYELVAFRFANRGDVDVDIPRHIRWSLQSLRCGAQYDYYGVKG